MEHHRLMLGTNDAVAAASLTSWLRRQGFEVSATTAPERMGAVEVVCIVAGSSGIRALASVVREWIRANRSTVAVRVEGRGEVHIEGAVEVEELERVLELASEVIDHDV